MDADEQKRALPAQAFRLASYALLSLGLMAVVSGVTLTVKGRAALAESDQAFHQGDMRRSIAEARAAALSYVPGGEHVHGSYERLEAIARGAESQGDRDLARVAWDTLRVVLEQTDYPGRPSSDVLERARTNLKRLREAREQAPPAL
jgi:hypothetical protein